MNRNNINCFHDNEDAGFYQDLVVEYNFSTISRAVMHGDSGRITFYYRDGREHQVNVSGKMEFCRAFIKQYGIGITEDEKYFFLPKWESGLYCFDLETGKMVWKSSRRHPREYVVRRESVVCHFDGQAVEILSLNNGDTILRYPFSNGLIFKALTDDLYLAGPKRGSYHLLDERLNVVLTIPARILNPYYYDAFMVLRCYLEENSVCITGIEYRSTVMHLARKNGKYWSSENHRFVRRIPIRKTKDGGYFLDETDET